MGDNIGGDKIIADVYIEKQIIIPKEEPPLMFLPPMPRKSFVGRKNELAEITQQMQENQQTILLNGLGGMGKSELLNCWVRQVVKKEITEVSYKNILYLDCRAGIDSAIEQEKILKRLNINSDEPNKFALVISKLSNYDDLLLVLDDLPWDEMGYDNNLSKILELCSLQANVIATSRRMYEYFEPIDVSQLDEESAIDLFKYHIHYKSDKYNETIKAIIQRAGMHTLSIEILAKIARKKGWSAEQLLQHLIDNNFDYSVLIEKVRFIQGLDGHNDKINEAMFKLFDMTGLSADQKELIFHLSCMNSQDFRQLAFETWFSEKKTEILIDLIEYGWASEIYEDDDNRYFRLHEMVTHTVNKKFTQEHPANECHCLMQPVAERMENSYQASNHKNRDEICLSAIGYYFLNFIRQCDKQGKHIQENTVDKLLCFSVFCLEEGLYNLVSPCMKQGKDTIKNILGANNLNYAYALSNLASLYQNIGDYKKSLSLYEQALEINKYNLGENHLDYATALNNIASIYKNMGNYDQALYLFEKALVITENNLCEHHPDYATLLNNIASIYENIGDYDQALDLFNKALKIFKNIFGENNSDYATALEHIASLYDDVEEYDQSLPLYQKALTIRKEVLGENHPDYASSLSNLAGLYDNMNAYESALPLYKQALDIMENSLGKKHHKYTTVLNNLAYLYENMEKYEQALPLYKQALIIQKNSLGEQHHNYTMSLNNLAHLYETMGDYNQAQGLYKKTLTIKKDTLGEHHYSYAISLHNLAGLYVKMECYEQSFDIYKQAITILQHSLGNNDPRTQKTITNYQNAKLAQKNN